MNEQKKEAILNPDPPDLMGLLSAIASHLDRIATYFEIAVAPETVAALDPSDPDIQRFDGWSLEQEELKATIEELEEEGVKVPAASYRLIGLEPPRREDEPDPEPEMDQDDRAEAAPEPDPTIIAARRRDA